MSEDCKIRATKLGACPVEGGDPRRNRGVDGTGGGLARAAAPFSRSFEYAPSWVQSVALSAIVAERANAWQNFHPEDFCHLCGRRNINWFVDSERWNEVMRQPGSTLPGIVCPCCFVELFGGGVWELRLDRASRRVAEATS